MSARQQAEESLRRAQHDDTVCRLIIEVADYLTTSRPMDQIREASRLYLASAKSIHDNAMDSDRAGELLRALLAVMPTPYAGETRGEYALRLRASVRA
ncbi:hypothetical protein ACTVZO_05370 [Streptomyces sp. IBSNAI002]|uniref:hypothetical protein n=1 Tax=Streptomyces sp. IBSNAI002 TaxID=3457500 RepID=UPI003FD6AE19